MWFIKKQWSNDDWNIKTKDELLSSKTRPLKNHSNSSNTNSFYKNKNKVLPKYLSVEIKNQTFSWSYYWINSYWNWEFANWKWILIPIRKIIWSFFSFRFVILYAQICMHCLVYHTVIIRRWLTTIFIENWIRFVCAYVLMWNEAWANRPYPKPHLLTQKFLFDILTLPFT